MPTQNAMNWKNSVHRGIALGLATALHLAVLVVITQSVVAEEPEDHAWPQSRQALQLRFIRSLKLLPSRALIPVSMQATAPVQHASVAFASIKSRRDAMQVAPRHASPAAEPEFFDPHASGQIVPTLTPPSAAADGDGGFADRLGQAKRSYSVGPLPGSDSPRVRGIELIDPRTHGIAATMRSLQSLFGVTNHHCIDVDVWRHLSPRELADRHISPSDVDRVDAENHCNRPLGLSL